jgi:phosphoribosylformimino-5-aminoimidazole carboxamide ribotide isomerase
VLILPAIDILGGKCVRLTHGDYDRTSVYGDDPAEQAKEFEDAGAEWLHVVDLDGAKEGKPVNVDAVRRIRASTGMKIELGGGIRSRSTALEVLEIGVDRVILGSALLSSPDEAAGLFQDLGDQVVAGIDMRDGMAAAHGWLTDSKVDGLELAKELEKNGCRRVIATDIATDGAMSGPNLEMIRRFAASLKMPVIASGGVTSIQDLRDLASAGAEGAIVGKALYEDAFSLEQALRDLIEATD